MEKISFIKMSGAGNDFVVIDKNSNPFLILNEKVIQKLCDRRNGIGADGVITISNSVDYDFEMEYFNADGSTGSLCGNGARCAIKFAESSNRIKNEKTYFLSNTVSYTGEVLDENLMKFDFNPPAKLKFNFKVKAGNQLINACFADTGSPHVVIKIEDVLKNPNDLNSNYSEIDKFPVFELGREIRYLKEFSPGGTNVNFIKIVDSKIYIRTYERGVEDETLACGTGATAAAIIAHAIDKLEAPVTLITRGFDELTVDFNVENQKIKNLSLIGPAKIIFSGEIEI
ncbi:MAG TPA: diaminopimelate epimerase [Ignavibacteriaceae bacterium]|nr:diaminopimelate epimerase [Ignavibacteriaceae bacterium]